MAENNNKNKHLFNSSEKTDFIVNMTQQGTQKLFGVYAIIVAIGLTICSVVYYFTKNIVDYVDPDIGTIFYLSDKTLFAVSTGLTMFGLIGYLMWLISHQKGQFKIKNQKEFALLGAFMIILCITGAICFEPYYAFFGYLNRSEGVLAYLAYFGLFILGTLLISEKRRFNVADVFVGLGFVQSAAGILQAIPSVRFPNWFDKLIAYQNPQEGIVYIDGYCASGFMGTPFALAAFLTMCFAVALVGAMYDKNTIRRVLYSVGAVLFSAVSILTHTFVGRIGIPFAAAAVLIFEIVRLVLKKKPNGVKMAAAALTAVLIVSGGTVFAVLNAGKGELQDASIMYTDTFDRLSTSTILNEQLSTKEVYQKCWSENFKLAKEYLFEGIGIDNVLSSYPYSELPVGLIDRPYNEYLYILECTGIFGAIVFAAFIIFALRRMFLSAKGFFSGKLNWCAVACSFAALGYLVQATFNISQNTVTPYFWLLLGMVFAVTVKEPVEYDDE